MSAPGSPEAVATGCKCPRKENTPGSGWYQGPAAGEGRWYVVNADCRIHGPAILGQLGLNFGR